MEKSYLGGHLGTGKSYLGLEIRTCGVSANSGREVVFGGWKIVPGRAKGAGDSYLGGLLEPSGGKSFLGGGKSYWGALLGTRKSYLGVGLAWKLIWGVSSGLETGT